MWYGSTSTKTLIQSINKGGFKLCHFETKVKALKLSCAKRLSIEFNATWKILPQSFYNCNNLNIFFSGNLALKSNKQIPSFYTEIYVYIKHLKSPSNIIQILKPSDDNPKLYTNNSKTKQLPL